MHEMKDEFFDGIQRKLGTIKNLDEAIDAFDLPTYHDDSIIIDGKKVGTFHSFTFDLKFDNEECRQTFRNKVKETGLVAELENKFGEDNLTENMVASVAIEKGTYSLEQYFELRDKKPNMLTSLIDKLRSKDDIRYEGIEMHRNKLKQASVSKSNKISASEDDDILNELKKEVDQGLKETNKIQKPVSSNKMKNN